MVDTTIEMAITTTQTTVVRPTDPNTVGPRPELLFTPKPTVDPSSTAAITQAPGGGDGVIGPTPTSNGGGGTGPTEGQGANGLQGAGQRITEPQTPGSDGGPVNPPSSSGGSGSYYITS